jgi:hypothetical protein
MLFVLWLAPVYKKVYAANSSWYAVHERLANLPCIEHKLVKGLPVAVSHVPALYSSNACGRMHCVACIIIFFAALWSCVHRRTFLACLAHGFFIDDVHNSSSELSIEVLFYYCFQVHLDKMLLQCVVQHDCRISFYAFATCFATAN